MNGKIKVKSQFLEEKKTYEKSEEKSYMENIMLKKKCKKLLSRAADFVQSQKHERKYNKMNINTM